MVCSIDFAMCISLVLLEMRKGGASLVPFTGLVTASSEQLISTFHRHRVGGATKQTPNSFVGGTKERAKLFSRNVWTFYNVRDRHLGEHEKETATAYCG